VDDVITTENMAKTTGMGTGAARPGNEKLTNSGRRKDRMGQSFPLAQSASAP